MSFILPELPYSMDSLSPNLSKETFEYHYGKHHVAYVNKLNILTEQEGKSDKTLETLILEEKGALYNNAAQHWNHSFFWKTMSPDARPLLQVLPQGKLTAAIQRDFQSFEKFKELFSQASLNLFGSGWVWLVSDSSARLSIMPLKDADNPLRYQKIPLLTLDLWEHAYYIDYRNARPKFIESWWELVNWKEAEALYAGLLV